MRIQLLAGGRWRLKQHLTLASHPMKALSSFVSCHPACELTSNRLLRAGRCPAWHWRNLKLVLVAMGVAFKVGPCMIGHWRSQAIVFLSNLDRIAKYVFWNKASKLGASTPRADEQKPAVAASANFKNIWSDGKERGLLFDPLLLNL